MPIVLRTVLRRIAAAPTFALVAVVTLALAIAANIAIFSLVDTVLLRPLPYPRPDRLVGLWHAAPALDLPQMPQSLGTYFHYRDGANAFDDIAIYRQRPVTLTAAENAERVDVVATSGSLFAVLGVPPALGRALREEDEAPGAQPVVVVAGDFWRDRLGGDPRVVGRTVRIDGIEREIVGVMPADFTFPNPEVRAWLPLELDRAHAPLGSFSTQGIGRLAEGFDREAARRDLDRLIATMSDAFPEDAAAQVLLNAGFAAIVNDLRDDVVGDVRGALWVLLGATGFLLLIACANVANLFLVRAEARQHELAVRAALGESHRRMVAGFLVESCLLGLCGGALGLAIALSSTRFLARLAADRLPRLHEHAIDGRVLLFALGISLLAGVLFGLVGVFRLRSSLRPEDLGPAATRATSGRSRGRVRALLVAGQVALAQVLLIVSGLAVLSFQRLIAVDPGFRADHVLTFTLALPERDYPDVARSLELHRLLGERLRGLPGVEAVGTTSGLPLSQMVNGSGHAIEDFPLAEGEVPPVLYTQQITGDYFQAMGIDLVEGRTLTPDEMRRGDRVCLVSKSVAHFYWPDRSALGKRLRPGDAPRGEQAWYTIVGVVGDVRDARLQDEPRPLVYYPFVLPGDGDDEPAFSPRTAYAVRTLQAPTALADAVRRAVRDIDPSLAVGDLEPMTAKLERSRARFGFSMALLAIAAGVALFLGSLGIYGAVSYTVTQRVPEIAIRMALGARPPDVRRMVLRDGAVIAAAGVVVGTLAAAFVTRLMQTMLFEVAPLEPTIFLLLPLAPLAVALASAYLPASRAAAVAPARALRKE